MGISIHHRLSIQKVNVKATLDRTEAIAKAIQTEQAEKVLVPFEIRRLADNELMIDIGGCETLSFRFYTIKELVREKDEPVNGPKGWNDRAWKYQCLTRGGQELPDAGYEIEKYPQNEIAYASGFCKTQYAKHILEHKWVADLIKSVAGYCLTADVNDEGDYYHSGRLEDAVEAIGSLGKMIDGLGAMLAGKGFEKVDIIKGGETVIKSRRKK